jgi:rhamnosyltransferase
VDDQARTRAPVRRGGSEFKPKLKPRWAAPNNAAAARLGLVIPTLNAGPRWNECLTALASQSLKLKRCLVVDSASSDETAALAKAAGAEVKSISRADFNHGGTRQGAVQHLGDCDIIIFLTQDAILEGSDSLAELVRCFDDPKVAVAYGRQLPHRDATAMEAHARLFNYGDSTQRKDLSALDRLGAKSFFCSNSFAAYRRKILMELGGFRHDLILGEDAEFAARAILAGYINVYCATATVYHSHDYNVAEVFWRYFDTGVFHARNQWLRDKFGSHRGEGMRFVRSELRYLAAHAPLQIPKALGHTFAKVAGYRLGRLERILPRGLKRVLSMTPGYWRPRRP